VRGGGVRVRGGGEGEMGGGEGERGQRYGGISVKRDLLVSRETY